ncbi:MAG: TetR/AcrR family transcriptional regulator [Desulfobacteraceae bacterium]|nr:TetR/AcrR family transcriptional regulator [Desulfobacteraceae bacterium]
MKGSAPACQEGILACAIPLFARGGFSGVSMREIARAVGLNAATLYYHFADKETLYRAAIRQAFADRARLLSAALAAPLPAEERVREFVVNLCGLLHRDPDFPRLLQREILDGDEKRLRFIAEELFGTLFSALTETSRELAPERDPFLLAISIIGLAAYHYQLAPLRAFLPGARPAYDDPAAVAAHIISLLTGYHL